MAPDGELTIRVRAAASDGAATREAAKALAAHLGVPPFTVVLRRGARSRIKTFDVDRPPSPGAH